MCDLVVKQINLGNCIKGCMSARGYKVIINKYYFATHLRHDKKQISNRIRQLKQYWNFIKNLQNNTGLGHKEDGTIDAT